MSIDLRKAGGDFIIMGSDASPLYNFSVVVDDGLMGITHVIRGEDHLPNTPRQILLFKALELKVPEYVHLPLVLAPDRTPLGKRHSSASLRALREEYLPEAVLNTVARLGWSPNRGVLSLEDMVKVFTTLRLSKSPSVFDMDRLKRFNKVTLAAMAADRLAELVSPYLEGTDRGWLKAAIDRVKGDCATVKEIPVLLTPLIEYRLTNEAKGVLSEPYAAEIVKALGEEVEKVERVDCESYRAIIDRLKQRTGEKGKRLLMPVRAALTGTTTGIELEKVFILLGKERIAERLSTYFK
jgi:glutamyl/glutaminyl-tRNA synthetase